MKKKERKENIIEDSKLFAFLATFLSIIGFLIALLVKKEDKYVMYYAKQSLIIFMVMLVAGVINAILAWIPGVGVFVAGLISVAVAILWIISWAYSLSGKEKEIPFISKFAGKLNL